jgi:hypothetical protein
MSDVVAGILVMLVVIALIIGFPLAVIWSLNTLFALGIAYTWKTWLSVIILSLVVGSSSGSTDKK